MKGVPELYLAQVSEIYFPEIAPDLSLNFHTVKSSTRKRFVNSPQILAINSRMISEKSVKFKYGKLT
jgi:hypothetical protein